MPLYKSPSGIHGSGLFTNEAIEINQEVGVIFFRIAGTGVFATDFVEHLNGRFTNHSANPNTIMEVRANNIILKAIRKINAGKEVTSNYHELIELFPDNESVVKLIKFW